MNQMTKLRKLTVTAIFSAAAFLLMLLETQVPFLFPDFLKFDISDIPALITSFTVGPLSGIVVVVMKNILHLPITQTGGIGELANALVGSVFVGTAGLLYKFKRTRKGALAGMLFGVAAMAVAGGIANYYILIPFYEKFMPISKIIQACAEKLPFIDSLEKVILFTIVPFNLLKGTVLSMITFLTYKKISPIIEGKVK